MDEFDDLFYENICLNTLDDQGWIKLYKPFIHVFGLIEAVVLCELIDQYKYWLRRDQLQEDRTFFLTGERIQQHLNLSIHKRKAALKSLKDQEAFFTTLRGIPAKTYYKINFKKLTLILGSTNKLAENQPTSEEKNQPSTKLNNDHNLAENLPTINKEINNKKKIINSSSSFLNTSNDLWPKARAWLEELQARDFNAYQTILRNVKLRAEPVMARLELNEVKTDRGQAVIIQAWQEAQHDD